MNKYIVDFQGFEFDRSFVIKELSIVKLYGQNVFHFMAKPPFNKAILSDDEQKCVSWLENHHHKIKWEDGHFEYDELFANLRETVRDANVIFIKGRERALFLQNVTGKMTVDLDQLDCPRATNLPVPELWSTLTCSYYTHSTTDGVCSLLQALIFKEWLKNLFQRGVDEVDS